MHGCAGLAGWLTGLCDHDTGRCRLPTLLHAPCSYSTYSDWNRSTPLQALD